MIREECDEFITVEQLLKAYAVTQHFQASFRKVPDAREGSSPTYPSCLPPAGRKAHITAVLVTFSSRRYCQWNLANFIFIVQKGGKLLSVIGDYTWK